MEWASSSDILKLFLLKKKLSIKTRNYVTSKSLRKNVDDSDWNHFYLLLLLSGSWFFSGEKKEPAKESVLFSKEPDKRTRKRTGFGSPPVGDIKILPCDAKHPR